MNDPESLARILELALRLAIEAPAKRGKDSYSASVMWATIEELRAELDRLGYEWKPAVKARIEHERKARADWTNRQAAMRRADEQKG
jgi:hypothetical protein